jgi:hypothetical protein
MNCTCLEIEKGLKCRQLCGSFHYGKDGPTEDMMTLCDCDVQFSPENSRFLYNNFSSFICRQSVLFFFLGEVVRSTRIHISALPRWQRMRSIRGNDLARVLLAASNSLGCTFDRSQVRSGEFNEHMHIHTPYTEYTAEL